LALTIVDQSRVFRTAFARTRGLRVVVVVLLIGELLSFGGAAELYCNTALSWPIGSGRNVSARVRSPS
jgi:hypothetical protein